MHKAGRIYMSVVLLEAIILFITCIYSIIWLWRHEAKQNIVWMIVLTSVISCILIPIESAIFHSCKAKMHNAKPKILILIQTDIAQIILPKLPYIFGALWLIYFISFRIIAGRYNWHQGSDESMYYLRPGSIIIFLSILGVEIPNQIIRLKSKQNGGM